MGLFVQVLALCQQAGLARRMSEPTQSWYELLIRLRDTQGLTSAPPLAIGDGALGFWKALEQVWPGNRGQTRRVHKTAKVLNRLPKSAEPKAKSALQAIWMAQSREKAEQAFDAFVMAWGDKYPKAVNVGVSGRFWRH